MNEEENIVVDAEETQEVTVEVIEEPEIAAGKVEKGQIDVSKWNPKTELGRNVKSGKVADIGTILDAGMKILEPEIVDMLLPNMEVELLLIGQSKGKFGGGQRRVFRQTQKKTAEGNKPHFATIAVVGNGDGYVGVGYGKSKETVPAREKAIRNAKMAVIKVRRGSGSWEDARTEPNSIPFAVTGKCGSSIITLIPAPKGTGLIIESQCAKILKAAGIKDIWSLTRGQTNTKMNLIAACVSALRKLSEMKIRADHKESLSIREGRIAG
ncbi:30S ribosomal protein S5 [Candidatus Woesearchaeota archaeon]|nr:30S ribosomal protein S5 [Candidatus Woesearchaeota archaeon]